MSVWFKQVTAEQFSQLDVGFWWREYGTCLCLHTRRVFRDVWNEWYDLRNWFALLMLPLAVVLSPLNMLEGMRQAKKDRERFGLTLHNQRNIEWLQAEQKSNAGGYLFECQECGRLYHSGAPCSPEEIERIQGLLTATNIEN